MKAGRKPDHDPDRGLARTSRRCLFNLEEAGRECEEGYNVGEEKMEGR